MLSEPPARDSHRSEGCSLAGGWGGGQTEDRGANQTLCAPPSPTEVQGSGRGSHGMEGLQLLTLPFLFFCFEKLLVVYLRETGRKNAP